MALTQISTQGIKDGTITNADINASAAIAGSKIATTFNSTITISNTAPALAFTDSDHNPDYRILVNSGSFRIQDATNSYANRFLINSDGHIDIAGNLDVGAGLDVTGAITLQTNNPNIRFDDSDTNNNGEITLDNTQLRIEVDEDDAVDNSAIKFRIDNSDKAVIDSSGNVGIGTTSPTGFIHIEGSSNGTETYGRFSTGSANGDQNLYIQSGSSRDHMALQVKTGAGVNDDLSLNPSGGNVGIGTSSPDRTIHCHNSSNTTNVRAKFSNGTTGEGASDGFEIGINASDPAQAVLVNYENSPMAFFTNASERMRIDSSGNVGIGTTNPDGDKLFVQLTNDNSNDFRVKGGSSQGRTNIVLQAGNASSGSFTSYRLQNSSGTNIGSFHFDNATDDINIFNGSQGGKIFFHTNESGSSLVKMTITDTGRLGIGTSSPSHLFHVNGTSRTTALLVNSSGGHNSSRVHIVGHSTGSHTNIRCADSAGNTLMLLRNDGPIFIPGAYNSTTSSSVNARLDSDGELRRSTSSKRYKKNITSASWGLAEVLKLKPITFKNNSTEGKIDDKTYAGFTAEDIHDLGLTEFVDYNENNQPDALAYGNMVALMAKAIQDLDAKVETLETKVAALKAS